MVVSYVHCWRAKGFINEDSIQVRCINSKSLWHQQYQDIKNQRGRNSAEVAERDVVNGLNECTGKRGPTSQNNDEG